MGVLRTVILAIVGWTGLAVALMVPFGRWLAKLESEREAIVNYETVRRTGVSREQVNQ